MAVAKGEVVCSEGEHKEGNRCIVNPLKRAAHFAEEVFLAAGGMAGEAAYNARHENIRKPVSRLASGQRAQLWDKITDHGRKPGECQNPYCCKPIAEHEMQAAHRVSGTKITLKNAIVLCPTCNQSLQQNRSYSQFLHEQRQTHTPCCANNPKKRHAQPRGGCKIR